MAKEIVSTDKVRKPPFPISSAVKLGGLVFLSGAVGIGPDGQVARDDFPAQMRQAMENVKAVLEAAGSSLDKVGKVTVFLADAQHAPAMNEIYQRYFRSDAYPARTTVVAQMTNPDLLVQIECVAEA